MDYLKEILINRIKYFWKKLERKRKIKNIVRDFLKRNQNTDKWQEIDFGGLKTYLLSDEFFGDIESYIWEEKSGIQDEIFAKAQRAADSGTSSGCRMIKQDIMTLLECILIYSKEWDDPNLYPYIRKNITIAQENSRDIQKILDSVEKIEKQTAACNKCDETGVLDAVYYHVPKRTSHYVETACDKELYDKLEEKRQVLILGMQGIGKTEGVLWYLEEKNAFKMVVWMDFASWERAENALADYLGVMEAYSGKEYDTQTVSGLLDRLSMRLGRDAAVVFDNVNDYEMLALLSKENFCCRVIITSCLNGGCSSFDEESVLYWSDLSMESSRKLLTELLSASICEGNNESLKELSDLCGGIPLVIYMAAAYIRGRRISVSKYLEICKEKDELKFEKLKNLYSWGKNVNIYATYWLSYEAVCGKNDLCVSRILLHIMLFLEPNSLSEKLLREISGLSEEDFYDGIHEILKYSLIRKENGTIIMKQVVQDVMRSFLTEQRCAETAGNVGCVLESAFWRLPLGRNYLKNYTELGIHALYLLEIVNKEEMHFNYKAELLRGIGGYYYLKGFYDRARQYMDQAISLSDLPEKKLLYLRLYGEMAEVYEAAGDNETAERYIEQVRPEYAYLQKNAPLTAAQILLVEAYLLENKEEYDAALAKTEEILELLENCPLESDKSYYLNTLICRINILNESGRYQEAEVLFENTCRKMEIEPEVAYMDPLDVTLYGSGANALLQLGEFDKAIACYKAQYSYYKEVYWEEDIGFTHPAVIYVCNNIALTYMKKGDFVQAENWLDQAFEIKTKIGFSHQEVSIQMVFYIAILAFKQGAYADCFQVAKKILADQSDAALRIRGYMWMALAEYGMKQWEKAKYHLEQADSLEQETGNQVIDAKGLLYYHESLIQKISNQEKIEDIINISIP